MKRLLSILVAALAAAFSFAATAQTCGNTVKVLFIIESTAASYISSTMGQSTTAFVATQVSRTNTILSNTNTGMQIASVGTTLGGLCCGGKTALRDTVDLPASGQTPIIGAVNWAKSQRAIAEAREAAGADVVVLVTNYVPDATGVAGSRCNRPGSPPPTAQNAVVGINAWAIGQGNEALAQQLARTMCMDESEGVTVATGTSASNCAIYFTQEYPRDGTGVSKVIGVPGQTGTACFISNSGVESPPVFAGVPGSCGGTVCGSGALGVYTRVDPSATGGSWNGLAVTGCGSSTCTAYCTSTNGAGTNLHAFVVQTGTRTTSGSSFTCPSVQQIPYFSGGAGLTYTNGGVTFTLGDASHDTRYKIANQGPVTSCFHNQKFAKAMKDGAVEVRLR
jgi:hypothetical protein